MIRHLSLSFTLMLAALGGVVGDARAQSAGEGDTAVLPVWNNASGKVEAVLVLEPANGAEAGGRFRFGNSSLDAAFGLDAGDSLALLCDRKTGVASAIGNLPNNCLLAALNPNGNSRRTSATAGWCANGAASAAIFAAVARLRASTSSPCRMSSEASAAAQASGLPL